LNYQENAGYLIKDQHGFLESFEREYYDLIRSAFLKYRYKTHIPLQPNTPFTFLFKVSKYGLATWTA